MGIAGYTGRELFRILLNHPLTEVTEVYGQGSIGSSVTEIHPHLETENELIVKDFWRSEHEADVYFICVPHGSAQGYVSALLQERKKVIDLSADYRFKDARLYERIYGKKHEHPELLEEAVYGMPEIHHDEIKNAFLVANPGCLARASILALYPAVKEGIIDKSCVPVVDAKTGVSGAGKGLREDLHFPHMNENAKPYSPLVHRHAFEIVEELKRHSDGSDFDILFVPHLLPVDRGILASCYYRLERTLAEEEVFAIYERRLGGSPFVRLLRDRLPELKSVRGTNLVEVSLKVEGRKAAVFVSLDNLTSGASGTAVHNFNIMMGFDEKTSLEDLKPLYP